MSKGTYTNVGTHPEDVADGRIVGPGNQVSIDATDPHNKRLITDGILIEVPKAGKADPVKKEAGEK